ncbi:MAG: RNA polymerase sigma factor [Pseudomonadota bacterium]
MQFLLLQYSLYPTQRLNGAKGNIAAMKNNCGELSAEWTQALNRLRNHFFDRDIEPIRPALRAHCLKLTKDPAKAEDLMQDALVRSLKLCQICGSPINVRAYVLRTATNLWIDELRKQRRARTAASTLAAMLPPPSYEPAEPLFELIAAELPEREFEALMLTAVYGFTSGEAASLLNTSPAAIKMATSRARKRLRSIESDSGVLL